MQCLLHSSKFIDNFINEIKSLISIGENCKSLYKLINTYSKSADNESISIEDLRNVFISTNKKFENHSQHDAQEYLRNYIENLGNELNKNKIILNYQELSTKNKSKKQLCVDFTNFFQKRENSIIIDLFYGEHCNYFKCTCSCESYSFEKIMDIPLLICNINIT